MERKERTIATSIKVPEGLLKLIDADVEKTGEFSSRTDWIIEAIREFLEYRTKIIAERKKAFAPEEEDFISQASEENLQNNKNMI